MDESHQKILRGATKAVLKNLIVQYEDQLSADMDSFLSNTPSELAEIHQFIGKMKANKDTKDYFKSLLEEKAGKDEE